MTFLVQQKALDSCQKHAGMTAIHLPSASLHAIYINIKSTKDVRSPLLEQQASDKV